MLSTSTDGIPLLGKGILPGWEDASLEGIPAADEIHIRWAGLRCTPDVLRACHLILSEDERKRAERFHFERDRNRFIRARGLLRMLLSRYMGVEPEQFRFHYGVAGKPSLKGSFGNGTISFNLSHSHDLAVYAIAGGTRKLGVDLEMTRAVDCEELAKHVFSPGEIAMLAALPPSLRTIGFFNCWTRKEAYLKAKGLGFTQGTERFSVSLVPGEAARLLDCEDDPREAERWSICDLEAGPGYVAALAIEGRSPVITYRSWPEYFGIESLCKS